MDEQLGYTQNIHQDLQHVEPKIDALLSQVKEMSKTGPIKYTPPSAKSRLHDTVVTAGTATSILHLFAGARHHFNGQNAAHSPNWGENSAQALSISQWVWDEVPEHHLTSSIIEDYLKTVFPTYLIIHVEVIHLSREPWKDYELTS